MPPEELIGHEPTPSRLDPARGQPLPWPGMEQLVITVVGDDRAGLVDALSGAITRHGGNWEQSHLAELAGKFAGVVLVTVPPSSSHDLKAELDAIEARGLLHIVVEAAKPPAAAAPVHRYSVDIVGQDHPGIVYEISHALAENGVGIEEFGSEVVPAPMGGHLFQARATVGTPESMTLDGLQVLLEGVASDLMVDLEFHPE